MFHSVPGVPCAKWNAGTRVCIQKLARSPNATAARGWTRAWVEVVVCLCRTYIKIRIFSSLCTETGIYL